MKCDEALALQCAYLDSELDPNTTMQVGQHLKSCPDCAHAFAEEESMDSWLKATLKKGPRSADLWERAEAAVRGAVQTPDRANAACQGHQGLLRRFLGVPAAASGQPRGVVARLAWAGLAAAWVAILFLNTASREPGGAWMAREESPSSAALRVALKQRQHLVAELSLSLDQPSPAKSKPTAPGSRSERQQGTLNT